MRLVESPSLPNAVESAYDRQLNITLAKLLREHAQKVNQMAAGRVAGLDGGSPTVPTSGAWAIGDFVRKSDPVEAGSASSKYVIVGWIRVTNGTGNVLNTDWLECRYLTGN